MVLPGLVRSWLAILAEQPPLARVLLLVLALATLSMYALAFASVVVRSRLPAAIEPPPRIVWQGQVEVEPRPALPEEPSPPPGRPTPLPIAAPAEIRLTRVAVGGAAG